jgi:hypothetical protein
LTLRKYELIYRQSARIDQAEWRKSYGTAV